jgi:hypothetical protein
VEAFLVTHLAAGSTATPRLRSSGSKGLLHVMSRYGSAILWVFLLFGAGTFNVARGEEPGASAKDSSGDRGGSVVVVGDDTSLTAHAYALSISFDTVVLGEFESIPTELENEPLEFRMVPIPFTVTRSFKGPKSDSVNVTLVSDMLVYPGDEVSRYLKRIQLRDSLDQDLHDVQAELEALKQSLEAGVIDKQQYEAQRSEKASLEFELLEQVNKVGVRRAGAIHMDTFYDRGGAIRPRTPYLIGLNQSGELEELPANTNIYWGPLMEDIVDVLDE